MTKGLVLIFCRVLSQCYERKNLILFDVKFMLLNQLQFQRQPIIAIRARLFLDHKDG